MARITTYNIQAKAPLPALVSSRAHGQTIFESFPGHKGRHGEKGGSLPKGMSSDQYSSAVVRRQKKATSDEKKLAATAPDISGDLDYAARVQAQMAQIRTNQAKVNPTSGREPDETITDKRSKTLLQEIYRVGPVPFARAMEIVVGKATKDYQAANGFYKWLTNNGYYVNNGKVVVYLSDRQPVRSAYPEKLKELKQTGKITRKPYLGDK